MTLREFVEVADKLIVERFDKTGCIHPMYHIIDGEGRDTVMPAPPLDKETAVKLMRVYLSNLRATRYLFVDEAWYVGGDESARDQNKWPSLEHHPQRREIVMYCAEDHDEPMIMGTREIIRKVNTRPRLGALEIKHFDYSEGRMVGLLPQRGAMQ